MPMRVRKALKQKEKFEMEERKMKETKESIKVLTEAEVIKLSNCTKRRDFIESFENWGIWLDIPELNVQIFKAELPKGQQIYVTRFKNFMGYGGEYASPVYRYGKENGEYMSFADSLFCAESKLKELKVSLVEERKNASSNSKSNT